MRCSFGTGAQPGQEETDKALAKARADNQQALHQAREKADKTLEQALASVESENPGNAGKRRCQKRRSHPDDLIRIDLTSTMNPERRPLILWRYCR